MDSLKAVFSKVKHFESRAELHAIVFIAQEIELISKKEYDFDYSLNLPFSESLERDYLILRDEGLVWEDEEGHIRANESLSLDCTDKLIADEKVSVLRELSAIDTKDLINVSRVLYLRKAYPDIKDQNKLGEKAKNMFFISSQSFKNIFDRLNDLSPSLAHGGV